MMAAASEIETVGLFLGKLSPLHKGHQSMIEIALKECQKVIVIIYDSPETTKIPLSVRAGWVREIYPTVEVLEAWDGPTEVGAWGQSSLLFPELRS